jgi:hypothetical protein
MWLLRPVLARLDGPRLARRALPVTWAAGGAQVPLAVILAVADVVDLRRPPDAAGAADPAAPAVALENAAAPSAPVAGQR